jgi:hypothetical protein
MCGTVTKILYAGAKTEALKNAIKYLKLQLEYINGNYMNVVEPAFVAFEALM